MESPKRMRPPRARLNLRAEVRYAMRSYPAAVRDLSSGGARLQGAFKPAPGERLTVTFLLAGGMRASVAAEIRWIKEEGGGIFFMGAKFQHTSDSRAKLDQLARDASAGRLG